MSLSFASFDPSLVSSFEGLEDWDEPYELHDANCRGNDSDMEYLADCAQTQENKMEKIRAHLRNELLNLTVEERERNYEEIHGVDDPIIETPNFVAQSLHQLEIELNKISPKAAYDHAKTVNGRYVHDKKFRLSFLRADKFDCQKAAVRLTKFLEEKMKLFGPDSLCRPIRLTDLDANDLDCLKSGCMQQLLCRDGVGRAVICTYYTGTKKYKQVDNFLKANFYLCMSMMEDEETQRRGVVSLSYSFGRLREIHGKDSRSSELCSLYESLPIRINSIHAYCNDPMLEQISPILQLGMGLSRRKKLRIVLGTIMEYNYHLMTFGIPTDFLPVSLDGELKIKAHQKWISRRRLKEMKNHSLDESSHLLMIDLPSSRDILIGRGRAVQNHPGNMVLRRLVQTHLEEYRTATKGTKVKVAADLASQLQKTTFLDLEHQQQDYDQNQCQCQFRFLKRDDTNSWWVLATESEAIEKIYKALRSANVAPAYPTFSSIVTIDVSKRLRLEHG